MAAAQLRSWASDAATDDGADDGGCDLVDLARIIEYAGRPEIRDPIRYVQVAVERRRDKGPEYLSEPEVAAGETGCRYAECGHVQNRRTYLAVCARNADRRVTTVHLPIGKSLSAARIDAWCDQHHNRRHQPKQCRRHDDTKTAPRLIVRGTATTVEVRFRDGKSV